MPTNPDPEFVPTHPEFDAALAHYFDAQRSNDPKRRADAEQQLEKVMPRHDRDAGQEQTIRRI